MCLFGGISVSALAAKSKALPFLEAPANLDGSMAGDMGFDPMGISNMQDLKVLRTFELKQGRVAQLAAAGFLVQELLPHIPGPGYDERNPLLASASVGLAANIQILLFVGCIELATVANTYGDGEPGNLGWGTKLLEGKTDAQVKDMKLKEIKHCRLAMVAVMGMIAQTLKTGAPLVGGDSF
jgi:hypothetical protein